MKKYFYWVGSIILVIYLVGALFAQDPYWYSVFVKNKVRYTTTAKAEFRDTGLYINSGADGVLNIATDGTIAINFATPTFALHSIQLDSGVSGGGTGIYDSLLIVIDVTGSTGGTADYDSIWIPVLATGL